MGRDIMINLVLAESIYVKRSKGKLGGGNTSRECVIESLWLPLKAENGYVELFPVMDNMQSVLRLSEKVPVDQFEQEFSEKEDSRDIYLELIKSIG